MTGPGDLLPDDSLAPLNNMPFAANEGYADLFCCLRLGWSSEEVSSLSEPVGGRELPWKPLGEASFEWVFVGVDDALALAFAVS